MTISHRGKGLRTKKISLTKFSPITICHGNTIEVFNSNSEINHSENQIYHNIESKDNHHEFPCRHIIHCMITTNAVQKMHSFFFNICSTVFIDKTSSVTICISSKSCISIQYGLQVDFI